MENSSLDDDMLRQMPQAVHFASFMQRAGAAIVDFLVLLVPIGINMYNTYDMKNMALMLVLNIVMMAYKPFMEWKYGKTVGKMTLNIEVTNMNQGKANLQEILLRNSLGLVIGILGLITTFTVFSQPGFQEVSGFMETSMFQQQHDPIGMLSLIPVLIYLIGLFVMLGHERKQCLHDLIGSTLVLDRNQQVR
jgi:uncharacterized RDD family membrane protein YckC